MVIDAVTEALFGRAFDRGGKIAASGKVLEPVVAQMLRRKFFRAKPPKTAGREEFGREFVREFLRECRHAPQTRRRGDGHCVDGAVDRRRGAAIRDREIGHACEPLFSRNDSLRRRGPECHAGPHAGGGACAAGSSLAILRRVRACLRKRKRQWRSPCWLMKPGTGGRRMCPPRPGRSERRCWERSRMRESLTSTADLGPQTSALAEVRGLRSDVVLSRALLALLCCVAIFSLLSCSAKPDPNTLVMIIESSPTNLDPRVGIDAQSERIDSLIFDDLLSRGDDLNVAPGLAERWEIPDPLTYIFHLHRGVKFHDGRPLTARDVKWTFDSLLQGKIRSTKAAVYKFRRSHRRARRCAR